MLNPITYTESIVGDFLRYQLSTYPFADQSLNSQMRTLLSLEVTRATPLMKGPYISLSRSFRKGAAIRDLAEEGLFHPHVANLTPFEHVYGHQETAIRSIVSGKTTLMSTGTGSGKTECFLYPIISQCLRLRDANAPEGVVAVIVYPMNALAEDQLERLRELLVGTEVSFGLYVGKTPENAAGVAGVRLPVGASQADYRAQVEQLRRQKQSLAVHPPEERVSREEIRTPGKQPRILLTNIKQLELLLTRQRDIELFDNARLDYLVFDEAHTFRGANGAETAALIRRLRTFCGKNPTETVCVATSATIADPERGPDAGREFAARFFGIPTEEVDLVGEEYEADVWSDTRSISPPLPGDPAVQLQTILDAVAGVQDEDPSDGALQILKSVFQTLTGSILDLSNWQKSLYERLSANEVVYQIVDALKDPRSLSELVDEMEERIDRSITEEEVLAWLALGAASRKDGRPLLRPIVHAFVRGVNGAVVTLGSEELCPKLWLSAEDAASQDEDLFRLEVTTCTTCGQHYFIHFLSDFEFTGKEPGGGEAVESRVIWRPLEEPLGGNRVVLLDRLILDEDEENGKSEIPRNTSPAHFCRHCGTLHSEERKVCDGCGREGCLVLLYVLCQHEDHPGFLTTCVACSANGRRHFGSYREPARAVRAFAVSDVHVLAQSMIQHAERRRLLVFADNRQDAAFQAGWMQDHARRYRLRTLMFDRIAQSPVHIGDLTSYLEELLDRDDDLSRSLIPEVWRVARKQSAPQQHEVERHRFLRIQVLRELTTGARQRIGLEPWGRMKVEYEKLDSHLPFFLIWSEKIGCTSEELKEGVSALLDTSRRARVLLDQEGQIFSKFWHESEREIQRGYMPVFQGGPRGLKLRREGDDKTVRVSQWLSSRGTTLAHQVAVRWGVAADDVETFFEELWKLLTEDLELLAPVILTGTQGRAVPGCTGVRQINSDKIVLNPHTGVYRCNTCRRPHVRQTPNSACMVWRCIGKLVFESEDPDNYDLMVLDQDFTMLRPREHSAQIPAGDREELERVFKGEGERVNTLVCTPTLELGVDIGALDAVLMRNVPPLPANYWQRVGRAGRRHRMAVDLTYARAASHDRSYFVDPQKMLQGLIYPPSFNLKNDVMVRKHIYATALTALYSLAREGSPLGEVDRQEVEDVLKHCLPFQVKDYLFDASGNVLTQPFDVSALATVISKHRDTLLDQVREVFEQGWPPQDSEVVSLENLCSIVDEMCDQLDEVIKRLAKRLKWAIDQMNRLDSVRRQRGTLDPEEDALRGRCDRLVKRLKGTLPRRRQEAEGYDDTNTYSVLAAEGFLPGYGLDTGWVVGFHQAPIYTTDLRDWELRRSKSLALREYVPGNLIYANGHRFLPRFFHLETEEPSLYLVDVANEAVTEMGSAGNGTGAGLGVATLKAVPMCDVDLPHMSHISDDEDYRFQLSVTVYGYEQSRHGGGIAHTWGDRTLTHRKSVSFRLVNVGEAGLVRNSDRLGYPVCLVCGQSRSPLASEADRENFANDHQERCGKQVEPVGFYADIVADAITLQGCESRQEAHSVVEALRMGAAQILEMEIEDLQLLATGRAGEESTDMVLYDPMPGGSGLLEQMISRWDEVITSALNLVNNCPSDCNSACVDCLLQFRNAYYHRHLNRHTASECLTAWGDQLTFSNDIPARLPETSAESQTVNNPEDALAALLERAGFHSFTPQHPIHLGGSLGTTTPDFYFEDPNGHYEGVCIYLDGMSRHIHGNPVTQQRDRDIREELRGRFYEVVEIPYGQLTDREAMRRHFFRLGRILLGREQADIIRRENEWFDSSN